jgi:hypothetical protein
MTRLLTIATGFILILLMLTTLQFTGACKKQESFLAPPDLPASHYNCIEVKTDVLVSSYFSTYGNMSMAENSYNNQYFVFKNLPVQDWMIKNLDQGFIWLGSGIKCLLANPDDMKKFALNDHIDVVGLNTGVIDYKTPGLLFKECYVIRTGAAQLPAGGEGGFVPIY